MFRGFANVFPRGHGKAEVLWVRSKNISFPLIVSFLMDFCLTVAFAHGREAILLVMKGLIDGFEVLVVVQNDTVGFVYRL